MTQPPQWPEQPEHHPSAGQSSASPPPVQPPPAQPPPVQQPPSGAGATQPLYPGATYGAPQPPSYGYGPPGYPPYPYAMPQRTNGLSVASMVISIVGAVGLCCYGVGGYLGALGAILGHVAKRQIRQRQEAGDGMAIAGIIVGWIAAGLAVIATALWVWFFVAAAGDPSFFDQLD